MDKIQRMGMKMKRKFYREKSRKCYKEASKRKFKSFVFCCTF